MNSQIQETVYIKLNLYLNTCEYFRTSKTEKISKAEKRYYYTKD